MQGAQQVPYLLKFAAGVEPLFLTLALCAETCECLSCVPCTGSACGQGLHIAAEAAGRLFSAYSAPAVLLPVCRRWL